MQEGVPQPDEDSRVESRGITSRQALIIEWSAALVAVITIALIMTPIFSRMRTEALRMASLRNLMHIGLALKQYSANSEGHVYPPLTPYGGLWMFDIERLHPKYLRGLNVLVHPAHPDKEELVARLQALLHVDAIDYAAVTRLASESYVYWGWSVGSVEELERLTAIGETDGGFADSGHGLDRLKVKLVEDTQEGPIETVPIIFENFFSNAWDSAMRGCSVLYADGRLETVEFGDAFPVLDGVAAAYGRWKWGAR